MQKFTLGTYNHFYMVPKDGFKNIENLNLTALKSDIIIERKVNLIGNKIIINRRDHAKYRPVNRSSFFYGSEPEIPDNSNVNLGSVMDFHITNIASFPNFKISYFLKQTYEQHHGRGDVTRHKVKQIKLLVNDIEAYLIYPNGMGRIYKNS